MSRPLIRHGDGVARVKILLQLILGEKVVKALNEKDFDELCQGVRDFQCLIIIIIIIIVLDDHHARHTGNDIKSVLLTRFLKWKYTCVHLIYL